MAARKLASKKRKPNDDDGGADAYDDEFLYGDGRGGSGVSTSGTNTPATKGPVPVDVFVPLTTRAVVITGPNTGGKTAAMKAVGLASLMSRAGLFIPAEVANLPWFDSVLLDIGDNQDLMQSLSTFSARLAKQRAILKATTPRALVLMDEVGTGTSPAEGAAIGGALLERLAGVDDTTKTGAAGLVLATTHHGELKALKYEHAGGIFENAAVEFDEVLLAPTYRLLWGVPGRSRALQIAERFGMEKSVVDDARNGLGTERVTLETTISSLETSRRDADENIAAARLLLSEVRRVVPRIREAADAVRAANEAGDLKIATAVADAKRARMVQIRYEERELMSAAARERRANVMQTGKMDFASAAAEAALAERETKRLQSEEANRPAEERAAALAATPGWVPVVGDEVVVTSTGMAGVVTNVSASSLITVQAGLMGLKVNAIDLKPDAGAAVRKTQNKPAAKARYQTGTNAARRVDALLGGGGRVAAGNKNAIATPPPNSFDFGYGYDATHGDEYQPTIGDTVKIKKTGVVGVVVDTFDGVLSVQAGRNTLKSPVEGVEFAVFGGGDANGASASVSKQAMKKQKKKGSGLPNLGRSKGAGNSSSSGGTAKKGKEKGPVDISDLMAKFNRQ